MDGSIRTAACDRPAACREQIEQLTTMMTTLSPRISVVEIQDFLSKNSHVGINDVDGKGRTILMNACRLDREDVVQFLLDKGADPNNKCKELNTALHFACHFENGHSKRILGTGTYHNRLALKYLRLVKILLTYGATVQRNIHGWNPVCYAAIANFKCIVEHFIDDPRGALSASDKIESLEILVFTLSVVHKDMLAPLYLSKVQTLRVTYGLRLERHEPSQLEECLEQMEDTEPKYLLNVLKHRHMELQGILIGYRVLPPVFRDIFLWENLFDISVSISYRRFFRVCDALLKLEVDGIIPVDTVLDGILHRINAIVYQNWSVNETYFNKIFTYLKSYKDVLRSYSKESMVRNLEDIHSFLGKFLNVLIHTTARNGECIQHLHSVAELAGVVTEVSTRYNIDITQPLMFKQNRQIQIYISHTRNGRYDFNILEIEMMLKMVMLSYSQLLHHENPSHQCKKRGETILHQLVDWLNVGLERKTKAPIGLGSIGVDDLVDLVLPVARKAIRHGCCAAVKDKKGRTALDTAKSLKSYFAEDHVRYARYKTLLKVLNNSPAEVSLQELAARVIVQTKIPYHDKLPRILSMFIED